MHVCFCAVDMGALCQGPLEAQAHGGVAKPHPPHSLLEVRLRGKGRAFLGGLRALTVCARNVHRSSLLTRLTSRRLLPTEIFPTKTGSELTQEVQALAAHRWCDQSSVLRGQIKAEEEK